MTDPTLKLMVAALAKDEAVAAASWRQWRASTDLHTAPWQQLQLLPLIPHSRLQSLLATDADADRLNGIVRRAWTESQLRLAPVLEAVASLANSGCLVGVFGAIGIHLRSSMRGTIRPLDDLRVLIARADLSKAVHALQVEGWRLNDPIPTAEALDWQTHIVLCRDATFVHLHWRTLDLPAPLAATCERDFLSALQPAPGRKEPLHVLAPGHELLVALADHSPSMTDARIPWQFDACVLAPQIAHWKRWAVLAAKYRPSALQSIVELRAFGIAVPDLPSPRPPSVFLQRLTNALRWRGRRIKRNFLRLFRSSGGGQ